MVCGSLCWQSPVGGPRICIYIYMYIHTHTVWQVTLNSSAWDVLHMLMERCMELGTEVLLGMLSSQTSDCQLPWWLNGGGVQQVSPQMLALPPSLAGAMRNKTFHPTLEPHVYAVLPSCHFTWLWVKNRYPKWHPGKWKP